MKRSHNPQMNDVELTPCPHCDKGIVLKRPIHNCKKTIPATEYISKIARVRITWTAKTGWQMFWWPEDAWVENLRFVDVFNWIQDKSCQFEPVENADE